MMADWKDRLVTAWAPRLPRIALVVNTTLAVTYLGLWIVMAARDEFWRADFSALYTGLVMAREGLGARIYDLDLQLAYLDVIVNGRAAQVGTPALVYPPQVALAFLPLAWLSRADAFAVWTLGQAALLLWLLRRLAIIAREWSRLERCSLVAAVLGFAPLLFSFRLGAVSLIVLVCLMEYYWALKQGHDARAGVWLALGMIKPQLVLLPAIALLSMQRWRALAGALLTGMALLVASATVLGWQTWLAYFPFLQQLYAQFDALGFFPAIMYNVRGLLTVWLGASHAALINSVSMLVLAAAAVAALLLWQGPADRVRQTLEVRLALTILLGLLCSPHLYTHDALVLVAPATLFYAYLREHDHARAAYAALVLSSPLVFFVIEFILDRSPGIRLPVIFAMAGLCVRMAAALYADTRGRAPAAAGAHGVVTTPGSPH